MIDSITNEHIGGFLVAEGMISLIFAPNKQIIPQAARIVRVLIGAYIYEKVPINQPI